MSAPALCLTTAGGISFASECHAGVRRTLGISCEAPKFTGLRLLHPLVRRHALQDAPSCEQHPIPEPQQECS